ncbi:hypothetical protein [Methylorubrum populi]
MSLLNVSALIDAFAACLKAEEILLGASLVSEAGAIRQAGEDLRAQARSLIERISLLPSDVLDRISVLEQAEVLEGADSPFALRIAHALMAGKPARIAIPAA